ncbi:hypothetical protein B0A52_07442 [Exophiala mesophila]|uniref:F-box domain-containing protein n=1 Tax=Exophiala mesophila TaxID=212818 RepID=A0A438MZA8_EXOME|nr:hypothetical protein B0A52_07442 [Exophiala mesophila]
MASLSLFLSRSKRSNSDKGLGGDLDDLAQKRGDVLLALPDEILTHIMCYLAPDDYYALRLTCRTIRNIIKANVGPITRSVFAHAVSSQQDSDYCQRLYPQPKPCLDETWLLQMLRRKAQIEKLIVIIAAFTQIKVYMMPTYPRFDEFAPHRRKLIRRFHSPAWTLYHFLERYRNMLVFQHPHHANSARMRAMECPECTQSVEELIRTYPTLELISTYHFYNLVLEHLRQLSRAPSYVGTIERRLRGWTRQSPTEAHLAQVVILGGIPVLSQLSVLKGTYNQRVEILGSFVDKIGASSTVQRRMVVSTRAKSSSAFSDRIKTLSVADISEHETLKATLDPPFNHISEKTVKALPSLPLFIAGDWLSIISEVLGPNDQITSTWGFVQNVLARHGDGPDYLEPVSDFT